MSRALGSFVVFVCALAVLLGAVAWWLGAPLLELALDGEQRQAPYHVLYMSDAADSPTLLDDGSGLTYQQAFTRLLAEQQVAALWRTTQVAVAAGEVADEWQRVVLTRFPSGAELVRSVTAGSYRKLAQAAPGGARMVLGLGSRAPTGLAAELLLVAAAVPEGGENPLPAALQPALAAGGRVLFDGPAVVLEGTASVNQVLLLGFDSAATVDDWLLQAATETELALLRTRVQALTIWRFMDVRR
ncbi:MAG: hypothetical protein AB8B93_03845 [Pseudomonadales bacterium]